MSTIGVIGAGLMGHGIAYLLAAAGHTVRVYDPSAEWRNSLPQRLEARARCSTAIRRCSAASSAHDQMAPAMKDVSFVFEAAPEKLPLKQQIFAELESVTAPTTILASNSSAIPVDRDRPPTSSIASAWSARISGIRRISCRWSK